MSIATYETTFFAEGPVKVTSAWVTGGGNTIALPEIRSVEVRVSKRPGRLAWVGVGLGLIGAAGFVLGGACPPIVSGAGLFFTGIVLLVAGAAALVGAALAAYPLQRELRVTVSGRNITVVKSADFSLLSRAAEAIGAAIKVSGGATSQA